MNDGRMFQGIGSPRPGSSAVCITAASFLLTGLTFGQTNTPSRGDSAPLEEIVVSATKRAESVQDVPVAVTALSGEMLKDLGLPDAMAVASQTPNLYAESPYGRMAPRFNLRGVGTNDYTSTTVSAVGVYFDDVFINSNIGQGVPIFDLDRVEVLRGPQGTLWGKNTIGGAINFVSRRPASEFDGYGRITLGNYESRELEAAMGGPITGDTLLGRVAFVTARRDGQFYNATLGRSEGGYEDTAARAQLLWRPTDNLEALLILSTRDLDQSLNMRHVGILPGGVDINGFSSRANSDVVSMDRENEIGVHSRNVTLNVNWEGPSGITWTSISSFNDVESVSIQDDEASPIGIEDSFIGTSVDQL